MRLRVGRQAAKGARVCHETSSEAGEAPAAHLSETRGGEGARVRTVVAVVFRRPQQRRSFAGVHRDVWGAVSFGPRLCARVQVGPRAAL